MILLPFAVGLLLTSSANAFWRLPCNKPVARVRMDPIVDPGQPNQHVHSFMGSSGISPTATRDSLRAGNCTTCKVKADMSSYWAPEMFYEHPNGSVSMVDHGGALIYYLQRPNSDGKPVQAFPPGLRMVVGDPTVRNDTCTQEAQAISWNCIDYNGPAEPQTSCWKNTKCPGSLRGQIFFRSCWDGKNLDSPDHKSHMAFPDGVDHGDCPASHPVRLVSIFYEFWHYVKPFNDLNDGGRFVLSNGDSTGCSYHGDFLEGWDTEVLQNALNTCTALSGVIEDCAVFMSIFTPDDEMNSCEAPNPYPQEPEPQVGEVLPYIPGCVAVTGGPAPVINNVYVPNCTALGVPANGSESIAMLGTPDSASSSASYPQSSAPAVGTGASTPSMPSGTPAMPSIPLPSAPASASSSASNPHSSAPAVDPGASTSSMPSGTPSMSSVPSSLGLSSLPSGKKDVMSMPTTTLMDRSEPSSSSLDTASPTSVSHQIEDVHADSSLSNSQTSAYQSDHTSAHHSTHTSANHAHHTSASDDEWDCDEGPSQHTHYTSSKATHSAYPTSSMAAPYRRHHLRRRGNVPEYF